MVILVLKILGTTAFPQQLLPLRWQQLKEVLLNLPSLPQPSKAETPLQVQCLNALEPIPLEGSSRMGQEAQTWK